MLYLWMLFHQAVIAVFKAGLKVLVLLYEKLGIFLCHGHICSLILWYWVLSRAGPPYEFFFRVKFYVSDPSKLAEEYTRWDYQYLTVFFGCEIIETKDSHSLLWTLPVHAGFDVWPHFKVTLALLLNSRHGHTLCSVCKLRNYGSQCYNMGVLCGCQAWK